MARASDTKVAEATLCEIAGVTRQRRDGWVSRGLLEKRAATAPRRELIALVVLRCLHDALTPVEAALAWKELEPSFKERVPTASLWVVYDLQYGEAHLAETAEGVLKHATGGGAVRVVEIGAPLARSLASLGRRLEHERSRGAARSAGARRSARPESA
jgi:hypothetical protein